MERRYLSGPYRFETTLAPKIFPIDGLIFFFLFRNFFWNCVFSIFRSSCTQHMLLDGRQSQFNRRVNWCCHLVSFATDVPDPPGRPLIMGFTSRSVNLSWAPSLSSHGSQVTHYIIYTRYLSFSNLWSPIYWFQFPLFLIFLKSINGNIRCYCYWWWCYYH